MFCRETLIKNRNLGTCRQLGQGACQWKSAGRPRRPCARAWKSLLKSETARMLPISVVHGQIDDERHLTCYFGMLFPTGRSFESRRPVGGGNTSRALRLRVAQAQRAARA